MLSHRLSPFCGLVQWEVFPGGFAVAHPPHTPRSVALVTPAARCGRATRMRLRPPGKKKSHVRREQAASTSSGDRAVLPSGLHGQLLNVREARSATLIVDPGKIFINTPGMSFRKTSDGCPCLKRT